MADNPLWTPKGLSNFDLCGIWVTCSSAKRRACDCECLKFLLGRRRAELESPTLVLDCICTFCSREVHRDAAESSATVRPHQVPRVTGTSLVDIQVRSQRNPHKTLLCSSTPRVLVQPGYPTRGGVGLSVHPTAVCFWGLPWRFPRLSLGFWGLVGLCWDLLGAPRAFSRLGCRRSVLVVCLSRCALALPFRLPAVCSVCSLRRLRALCCPRSLWPLGRRPSWSVCCSPLGLWFSRFSAVFWGCWAHDENSELRSSDCESHCHMDFAVLTVTRSSRNFSCSCLHFAGSSAISRSSPTLQNAVRYVWYSVGYVHSLSQRFSHRPSSVLILSTRTLSPLLVSGHPLPFKSDTKAKLDATISSAIASWHHRIPEAPRGS